MDSRLAPMRSILATPGAGAVPSRVRTRRASSKKTVTGIIRCGAFKRLVYKTQVFVNHEGDMFPDAPDPPLEVAQVARQVARHLRLNEDLTERVHRPWPMTWVTRLLGIPWPGHPP